MLSKSLKTLLGFGLLGFVGVWIGCSASSPVAPSAGKSLTDSTASTSDSTGTASTSDSTASADSWFTDANLEAAVRTALGFPTTRPISVVDIASLTKLEVRNKNIRSLAGLEHAWGLDTLMLAENKITDLSPLARLTNLKRLSLKANSIEDVSPLASLTNLQVLNLGQNKIEDVSPLASLTNLRILLLRVNKTNKTFTDVSPLASLTNLQDLNLNNTYISDVSPLTCLPNLNTLGIVRTPNLSEESLNIYIPFLRANGVSVEMSHGRPCSPECRDPGSRNPIP